MREWLIVFIVNWLQRVLGKKRAESQQENQDEKVKHPPCPICGEEWDEKEVFCYYCGYQMLDKEVPLNPPPVHVSGLTDPDGIIAGQEASEIRERFDSIGRSKGTDITVLVLPGSLRSRISFDGESWNGFTMGGISYALYNTWKMGSGTSLKGLLLVFDPQGPDRVLVAGKKGPNISGNTFRSWFRDFEPEQNISTENKYQPLIEEIKHIAGKIEAAL